MSKPNRDWIYVFELSDKKQARADIVTALGCHSISDTTNVIRDKSFDGVAKLGYDGRLEILVSDENLLEKARAIARQIKKLQAVGAAG